MNNSKLSPTSTVTPIERSSTDSDAKDNEELRDIQVPQNKGEPLHDSSIMKQTVESKSTNSSESVSIIISSSNINSQATADKSQTDITSAEAIMPQPKSVPSKILRQHGTQKRPIDDSDNNKIDTPVKKGCSSSTQPEWKQSNRHCFHVPASSDRVGLKKLETGQNFVDSPNSSRSSVFKRISLGHGSNDGFARPDRNSRPVLLDDSEKSRRSFSCPNRTRKTESDYRSNRRRTSFDSQTDQPLLYCYGDSFIGTLTLFHERKLKVHKFKAASAKGLNNSKSTLQVGKKILDLLDSNQPKNILMLFGNVDFHINFIYQLQTKGDNALGTESFGKHVFQEYTSFIKKHILNRIIKTDDGRTEGHLEKILICSVIMPVVEDEFLNTSIHSYTAGDKTSSSSSTTTTVTVDELLQQKRGCDIDSRRKMVSEFNARIREWCADLKSQQQNVIYVDINQYITQESTNVVKQEYRDLNPVNMHILWEPTVPFWLKEIINSGFNVSEEDIKVNLSDSLDSYLEDKRRQMKEISENRRAKK